MMKVKWRAPSNIALIKYWGKYGIQLPSNPSLSLTLNDSTTTTSVECLKKTNQDQSIDFDFYFENEIKIEFREKIENFLNILQDNFDFINKYKFVIKSTNTFPHSAGIASSASSMAALSLCFCELHYKLNDTPAIFDQSFFDLASNMARLGSGSASRSLFPGIVAWGENDQFSKATQTLSSQVLSDKWPNQLNDAILIVTTEKKKVLSRQGHSLMENHPYAQARYQQAKNNFNSLVQSINEEDFATFSDIVENEALSIHALMLSSNPGYTLLKPNSFLILEEMRKFRKEENCKICFTIDAGPNIHLLYPNDEKEKVEAFIEGTLKGLCENGQYILDKIGTGPLKVDCVKE
jgi:diphosphomevalonate decarboxylase